MSDIRTSLILGAGGMVGADLGRSAPRDVEVVERDRSSLDITDEAAVLAEMEALRPDVVFNAAAYTAVDAAEEDADRAFAINGQGVANVARACRRTGARLVHLSTDFVFDGESPRPYAPDAPTNPISVYGASKRDGELCVQQILGDAGLIVRTAWVYSSRGRNFALSMLERMRAGEELRIVGDQLGTPTWSRDLARNLWRFAESGVTGLHHWTHAGVASWYDFCVAIQDEALSAGLLDAPVTIKPIRTRDYPTPATRPAYGVLDKTHSWRVLGRYAPYWREGLQGMLRELSVERVPEAGAP